MQLIWPALRTLIARQLYRRCARCILNERAAQIDPLSGLCSHCAEHVDRPAATVVRDGMRDEMSAVIRKAIDAQPAAQFHAVLLFSGGKDSCYMLMRLMKEFPDIRILCLSVDNTFMSPVAIENINTAVKALGAAHLWVRPPAEMMAQVFKTALSDRGAKMGIVDHIDGEFRSDIAKTIAHQHGVSLIFMGLSPEQVEGIVGIQTFEMPPVPSDPLPKTQLSGMGVSALCDQRWSGWWWAGQRAGVPLPSFIFPLYAWQVSEPEIIAAVAQSGIVPMKKLSPMLTNHALIVPMAIVDYVRHGYFTYEPEFAEMIRVGRARRSDWIGIFEYLEYAAKTGRLLPASFDHVLTRLGLTRQELGIPGTGHRAPRSQSHTAGKLRGWFGRGGRSLAAR